MKKLFITLLSVTVFLTALLYFENDFEKVASVFLNLSSDIEYKINDIKSFLTEYGDIREENIALKAEVRSFQINQNQSCDYKNEYERLYNLLDLKNEMDKHYKTTAAKVISYSDDRWCDTMIINKGKYSNISVGDAVISDFGVVGRIKETFNGYSIVSTILNPDISFSSKSIRCGDFYQVNGDFSLMKSGLFKLTGVGDIQNLILGDVLVSTGYGIQFPDGIPVGAVKEIKYDDSFSYAIAEPVVDFSEIREVLIFSA